MYFKPRLYPFRRFVIKEVYQKGNLKTKSCLNFFIIILIILYLDIESQMKHVCVYNKIIISYTIMLTYKYVNINRRP